MKSFILFLAAAFTLTLSAQATPIKKVVETSFWVSGDCGHCKATIEKALDVKGVKYASYDLASNTLTVAFKAKHISEDEIHGLLHAVGHQTKKASCCAAGEKAGGCCADKAKKCDDKDHDHGDDDSDDGDDK